MGLGRWRVESALQMKNVSVKGKFCPLPERSLSMSESGMIDYSVEKSKENNVQIRADRDDTDKKNKKGGGMPVAITFSYRRGRVRIYKSVITLLGNPPYIRFLINRETKSVCVQGWSENERDVIEVPDELYKVRTSFGINSKALVRSITDIMGWSKTRSYRVKGSYIEEGDLVEFPLSEAVELLHEKDGNEEKQL